MHGGEREQHTDFDLLERQVCSLFEDERDFLANTANFAALVYCELPDVNWAGFYFPGEGGLVLGPFGGKPACTRLPYGKGVCNAAFERRKSVVVDDVNAFPGHIACDSASRSELVVPLLRDGAVYGVFDIDSPRAGRFTDEDRKGIERLVARFMERTPMPERYRTAAGEKRRMNERIDVQTCRDHHVVLRYLLDDLNAAGTAQASHALLGRLRSVLVRHLKLEDDWLYPRLAQSENAIVRAKAERYRTAMGTLREEFEGICKRWTSEHMERSFDEWRREWQTFSAKLENRICVEDGDLYKAAEADLV